MRHVALLIESTRGFPRGLLKGIARYSREHGFWSMYFESGDLPSNVPRWLRNWKGDGIIARITQERLRREILSIAVPTVDLFGSIDDDALPVVGADIRAVIRLAFEHLRDQGLRNFAYCGPQDGPQSPPSFVLRRDTFVSLVEQFGAKCALFEGPGDEWHPCPNWERQLDAMAAWLRRLPKPIGVLTSDDHRGFELLDACRRAGIKVPDEVSVVGINNDELLCELASPSLSSVDPGASQIGYEAAALLDRMMRGARPPRGQVLVKPVGLVVRQSSDVIAVDDPDVAEALRLIRRHSGSPITVEEILQSVSVSRRALQRKFQEHLGRTPKEEINRVRITRAQQLLARTNLSLIEISRRVGFRSEKYFSDAFVRETGVRPSAFRRQSALGARLE